jgi:hypothetical protein
MVSMVRKARVEFAGAVYHVLDRGGRREPIFKDDADRRRFHCRDLIDGRILPLTEAIDSAVRWGMPSVVSCTPRVLADVQGE